MVVVYMGTMGTMRTMGTGGECLYRLPGRTCFVLVYEHCFRTLLNFHYTDFFGVALIVLR